MSRSEEDMAPEACGEGTAPTSTWGRREFLASLGYVAAFCVAAGAMGCGGGDGGSSATSAPASTGVQPAPRTPVRWPIAAEVYTTAEQQILPIEVPAGTPQILPREVQKYAEYGYSAWQAGPGTTYPGDPSSNPNPGLDVNNPGHDLRTDLAPGYAGAANVARLLHFFTMSDVHLADKESPAQGNYVGWVSPFRPPPALNPIAAWSPVVISTTQVLDAAIQTINVLHQVRAFDFGMCLGDVANNCQYNELRWFIDCMDGKVITPSSGANAGSDTIDYQMPFQAYGLNPAIPWFQVVGNHDQYWMGACYEVAKTVAAHVGSNVIDINPATFNEPDSTGAYMGVVDGTTPLGTIIDQGPDRFTPQPTVVPDPNRHTLESYTTASDGTVTVTSTTLNYMSEFFNTTSTPAGHGFTQANLAGKVAYYSFQPVANLPFTVIVLNDNPQVSTAHSYANGSLDLVQYQWLQAQLAQGQAANQLMIIASHIPLAPQTSITDPTPAGGQWDPTSAVQQQQVLDLLWGYPNCIMWLAGHRHVNVITPQVPPAGQFPSPGFWEVETPSLRDFPQGFRSIELRRNSDLTLSILVTTVNPAVTPGSPAGKSRGYSIGAARTFGNYPYTGPGSTASQSYNAELIVPLTPQMQAIIANLGSPLA